MKNKKIVFMGTPEFSVPILEMLIGEGYNIVLVVTQPDKAVGRKKEIAFSKVKEVALKQGLNIFQPEKLRKDYQPIVDLNPDLIVTAAYGQILPRGLLDQVKAINVHGSLLPKFRGGAPIQYALFEGCKTTGITIMEMAYGMDSGDMIKLEELVIDDSDNYTSLTKKLSILGTKLLKDVLPKILDKDYTPVKQNEEEVSFAYNIKSEEEFLDFHNSCLTVINKIRGLSQTPGAAFICNNTLFKVYKATKSDIIDNAPPGMVIETKKRLVIACLDGNIEIDVIKQQGKKEMNIKDFLNGQSVIKKGDVLERNENE